MAIELGGGWFLDADELCYMLGKRRKNPSKKTGEYRWEYFFPTLAGALEHFVGLQERAEIARGSVVQATELISAVNRAHEQARAQIQACATHFPELPV